MLFKSGYYSIIVQCHQAETVTWYLKLCHLNSYYFYTEWRVMSKNFLKHGFTSRCVANSYNGKLNIHCSVGFLNAPPQSNTSVPGSSSLKLCNTSGPCPLLNNMAEEENSPGLHDHSLLTGICLWDVFTEQVLVAKTEVNEKRTVRVKRQNRKRLSWRNASWVLSMLSSAFFFYLNDHHQLILKSQLPTFAPTTTYVC